MSAASADAPAGDGRAVRHDPAAEDLDLMTVLEARARILEEMQASREFVRQVAGDGSRAAELAAAQARLVRLAETIDRLDHPAVRPPDLGPRGRSDG